MPKLKIGLIAFGHRGNFGFQFHRPAHGVEVVAGSDINPQAQAAFRAHFPHANFYENYLDLLDNPEIDAVVIASPDFLHETMTVAALEHGKAVYLEKPMAITIEGCDHILETAKRTGSKLFIGHNMRYFPVVKKMKEVIDSGLIGEVQVGWCRHFIAYGGDAYFCDWHSEQRNSTGLLVQKGAHDIDVMHYLMGSYTKSVVGMGMLSVYNHCKRRAPGEPAKIRRTVERFPPLEQDNFSPVMDIEDHNMVMMQLENGAQMNYLQCHYAPNAERNYTFIGTKGRVENIGDTDECEVHVWTRRGPRSTPDIIYQLKPEPGGHDGSDEAIITDFLDFIMAGKATCISPIAARNVVAVGVLGHYSMRHGNIRQDIPALAPDLVNYFNRHQVK